MFKSKYLMYEQKNRNIYKNQDNKINERDAVWEAHVPMYINQMSAMVSYLDRF